ncbi:FACT complex subunit Ssrp1 isoform X2 [Cylas formicarius]|uniref:FACT complex subunit Ssrp1 isoform X2 n=1 Tax=Cylas formicarius TaxID=197179 RepID=UPI00295832CA|nr:FACT complex subunit Ssrp1 isoform X2 [Cylas formicarius]
MDFLEYSDISAEIKGCMTPGKLKMTDQSIVFKNGKTGKVDQIPASDFEAVNFQNFGGSWGIRVFLQNGSLHRFVGFKESEKEKIAKFFTSSYKIDMLEKELSLKGWNWGTAKFNGSVLSFDVADKSAFEIPLNHVSQCTAGKNEITMEFHQNDDAPVSLLEMRFFIPSNELAGDVDPVEAFQQQIMKKASIINVSGDAIAIFREIHCLTPRGRYDVKIFSSFFQLHGKTFDYKIPMSTVLRLFILPHKDSRQTFFVVSLDPPIKQGQTRYHFLVLLFKQEDETSLELPFTDEELKEKYEGKLDKELSGPTYEVLGKIMKNISNRKLTGPGNFIGHSGTPAVGCSFKAAAGYLYPLERGFIYIHKPPLHIRFEEITSVNFARGGGNTRSFDFEIELKSGTVHTFSNIEKEEYGKLFDFINSKKLHIKNRGKSDKASYKDDFGDSDEEAAPDAYLERVKAEGQEREESDDDEDESTDEDYDPSKAKGGNDSDVAEEFDSDPSSSESDDEGGKKEKKKEKEKKKSSKTVSEQPRKRSGKKERDENKPKRAATAFMLWLNANRESIKKDNPGIKITEIAKKGGEMWRELKDKSEWEKKAAKEKEEYNKAMVEYKASGGSSTANKKSSASKKSKPDSSPVKSGPFKSKEYIEESDSSSDDEKAKKDKDSQKDKTKKSKKSDESDEEKGSKRKKESDDEKSKKKSKKDEKSSKQSKKRDSESEEILSTPSESENESDEKSKKSSKGKSKSNKKEKSSKKGKDSESEEEILSTPPSSGAESD